MHPTSYYSRLESISTIVVATLLILVSIYMYVYVNVLQISKCIFLFFFPR